MCCVSSASALPALIDALNATGYALTGGVHSRIDSTIDLVAARLAAGNIYVNRNIIGAVVGAQPFGGHGLSGTGPKAGGPLYLKRLLAQAPAELATDAGRRSRTRSPVALREFVGARGHAELARAAAQSPRRAAARDRRSNCPARSASAISIALAPRGARAVRRGERSGR